VVGAGAEICAALAVVASTVCSVCDISAAGVWQTNTIIVVGAAGAAMLVSKYTNIDSSGFL